MNILDFIIEKKIWFVEFLVLYDLYYKTDKFVQYINSKRVTNIDINIDFNMYSVIPNLTALNYTKAPTNDIINDVVSGKDVTTYYQKLELSERGVKVMQDFDISILNNFTFEKKNNVKEDSNEEDIVVQIRKCYLNENNKPFKLNAQGTSSIIKKKLEKFKKDNPDITNNEIVNAIKSYISDYAEEKGYNFTYLVTADYVIYREIDAITKERFNPPKSIVLDYINNERNNTRSNKDFKELDFVC